MRTYTIEEIKQYILSQDSLGDVMYNLNERSIDDANAIKCPECLTITEQSELDMFGGLCEFCTEN